MSPDDYTAAYDLLRELLKNGKNAKRLSQEKLAKKLDVQQSYVSKYEIGERRLDFVETLEVLAALGIDAATFIREFRKKVVHQRGRKPPR